MVMDVPQVPYAYPVANPAFGRPPASSWSSPAHRQPPRSTRRRLAIFAGAVASWLLTGFVLTFLAGAAVTLGVDRGAYATEAAYDAAVAARFEQAWPWIFGGAGAALVVASLVAVAVLAPKVRYRWFDTFRQLVPVYGWYFAGKILWRCTDLTEWRPAGASPWEPGPWAAPQQPYAYPPPAA